MKGIFTFAICFQIGLSVCAQNNGDIYKVKNGTDISKTIPFRERYLFDKFHDGKVYFRNGKITKAKLNYSLYHGEIQFIGAKEDTLLLADNSFINKIVISNEIFYYSEVYGHMQQKLDFGQVKLGEKQLLLSMGNEKFNAYNQYSANSSTWSYSSFLSNSGEFQWIQPSDKIVLRRTSGYFWIDKNQRFYKANKANLLKIYPDLKKEVNAYILKNNTNFESENDLAKILKYCNALEYQN